MIHNYIVRVTITAASNQSRCLQGRNTILVALSRILRNYLNLVFFSVAVGSKRKFWNPRKWFKRKQKSSEDGSPAEVLEQGKDVLRSRSTSELSITEEQTRRR